MHQLLVFIVFYHHKTELQTAKNNGHTTAKDTDHTVLNNNNNNKIKVTLVKLERGERRERERRLLIDSSTTGTIAALCSDLRGDHLALNEP